MCGVTEQNLYETVEKLVTTVEGLTRDVKFLKDNQMTAEERQMNYEQNEAIKMYFKEISGAKLSRELAEEELRQKQEYFETQMSSFQRTMQAQQHDFIREIQKETRSNEVYRVFFSTPIGKAMISLLSFLGAILVLFILSVINPEISDWVLAHGAQVFSVQGAVTIFSIWYSGNKKDKTKEDE